jgi:cytoskeleton protein RodZ
MKKLNEPVEIGVEGEDGPPGSGDPFQRRVGNDLKDFGLFLKRERELRNVTLEEIAKTTRIGRRYLEDLEEGRTGNLPAPAFVKGFLASFAKYIGLDPEEVLTYYEEVTGREVEAQEESEPGPLHPLMGKLAWVVILMATVAFAIWVFTTITGKPVRTPPPVETAVPEASVTEPEPAVEDVTGGEEAVERFSAGDITPEAGGSGVELVIRSVEKTWVYAVIDEQDVRDLFLYPGETITLSARRQIGLTLGNAGGVEATFNGRELEPLGLQGEVKRNLLFTWDPEKGPDMEAAFGQAEENAE